MTSSNPLPDDHANNRDYWGGYNDGRAILTRTGTTEQEDV